MENKEALHRVKRAIILAAGGGTRLYPLTLITPKPLISVNGVRMIDSIISALQKNGILEIIVVVGYRKDAFLSLEVEVPGLKLVENPWYDTCNNISSLYAAREHIDDAIILDGDQMIFNPVILAPEYERSGYNAVWQEEETHEWMMTVEHGVVTSCSRTGGSRAWQLYSISRWSHEDGAKLRRHLEEEFEQKQNRQIYWDDVALFCHPEDYQLGIREMHREDIIEIDDLRELAAMDAAYAPLLKKEDS